MAEEPPTSQPSDGAPAAEEDEVVLASMVQGTLAAFTALGLSPRELYEACGSSPEALADPDALVDYEILVRLWEAVLARFPAHPIGLTMAREGARVRSESLGVFGYVVQHCRDVRQSIELFARYCPMTFPRLSVELRVADDRARIMVEHEPRVMAMVEPLEMFVASLVHDLSEPGEDAPPATEIAFGHPPKHAPGVYAELVPVPVRFEAGWNGLSFDAAVLDRPVTGADPRIGKYLRQQADAQLQARLETTPGDSLEDRVRALVDDHLMAGTSDQASIARSLGMSPRTLQRRLEQEGTSFGRLLEDVRRQRALQLLALPGLSVGEVAFCLGYANPRAFYRSFRRWTGCTPSQWRARGH